MNAPMHSNPQIAEILQQLHEAADCDEREARLARTKKLHGFYLGRADAKRHVISVLAQVKLDNSPSAGADAVAEGDEVYLRAKVYRIEDNGDYSLGWAGDKGSLILSQHELRFNPLIVVNRSALTPAPTPVED